MIIFNQEVLNQRYIEIWEKLTLKGIPVPYLIKENTNINYKPSDKENNKLKKKLSKEVFDDLTNAYYNRRIKERKIYNSTRNIKQKKRLLYEYKEKETLDFIKKFPDFKDIILKKE